MKKVEAIRLVQSGLFCRAEYVEDGSFKIEDMYGDFYGCFGYTYGMTVISATGLVVSHVYDAPVGVMI